MPNSGCLELHEKTELTRLVSKDILRRLQSGFTELGKVTVCVCAVDGLPIISPTWGSQFSHMIGCSPLGREAFSASLKACAIDPASEVPSVCHEGMTLYASTIETAEQRLGLIVVGSRMPTAPPDEAVRRIAKMYGLDPDALVKATTTIDPCLGGTPEAIRHFADILADTLSTLYKQSRRIECQLQELRIVHDLGELISGPLELQEMLDRTVQRVESVMSVKACAIRILDESTGELVIKAVHNLSDEYLQKGPVLVKDNAIDSAACHGEVVYIADAPNDPRIRYPQNALREGIVSGLCAPMSYRGQSIGVIRVYTDKLYEFNEGERALLKSIGTQTAAAIINSRLHEDRAKSALIERQVTIAGKIQRRMLPALLPRHPSLQFGCVYDPTLLLGGDFYDFIELGEGRMGVCIADVVGKGLPAAMMMASIRSALRAYATDNADIGRVMQMVNEHMVRDTLPSEFVTLVYGVFSADGQVLSYSNAGHPPPVVLRGDNFINLDSGGTVIGILSNETFDVDAFQLKPNDLVVMTTDGVTEAMGFDGQCFGPDRLLKSIWRHRELGAQQLAHQILWDVRRFVGLAEQSDDITIVVAKARPNG